MPKKPHDGQPGSMAKKLTIWLVLLVGLIEAIILGSIDLYSSHRLKIGFEHKVDSQFHSIKANLSRLLWTMDYEEIDRLGNFYTQSDIINGLSIWRDRDILLFHSAATAEGTDVVQRSMELEYDGIHVGRAVVTFSMATYHTQRAATKMMLLTTLLVSLLIISAATGMLLRFILNKPFLEVTSWIDRIANGDYATSYAGTVYTELKSIVRQFTKMASVLEEKETHLTLTNEALVKKVAEQVRTQTLLKAAHADLETKIAARTAELRAANQELLKISNVDGLTQIANRRQFDERSTLEWRKAYRDKKALSLIVCDIDFFKAYNDKFGHQAGDDCLKKVAAIIDRSLKRPSDLASRYGGEEFAVIMPDTDLSGAMFVAQNIQSNIISAGIPCSEVSDQPFITLSLGVSSVVPGPGLAFDDLFSAADKALYAAKARGRNCIVSWQLPG